MLMAKLIWKLHEYVICLNVLNCLQQIFVAGQESGLVLVTSWVPQGSLLSCSLAPPTPQKKICVFQVTWNFKIGTEGRKIFLFC